MTPRRQVSLCREGWYYAIVLGFIVAGAVLREVNLLFVLAAIMMGPLFFSWRMARGSLGDLRVARHILRRPHAGESVPVELELANARPGASSWALVVQDSPQLADAQTGAPRATFFPHVGAGESRRAAYAWRPERRGRYRFGRLSVATRFPFGFIEASWDLEVPQEVLVAPQLGRLRREGTRWLERLGHGAESAGQRRGLREGDYYGLREWRPGDSQRWIHWRSSARQGRLMTLQFEDQRHEELVLLVDLWAPATPSVQEREKVELALSFAATIVVDCCRRRNRTLHVGLAGAESRSWNSPASSSSRDELLDAMADWRSAPCPDLSAALPRTPDAGSSARVVVISTRSADADTLTRLEARERGCSRVSLQAQWVEVGTAESALLFEPPTSVTEGEAP